MNSTGALILFILCMTFLALLFFFLMLYAYIRFKIEKPKTKTYWLKK